jgi:outer membrane biosynthesis protein TonB
VYAGHDGQVYRRTDKGWESNNGKAWSGMKNAPEAPVHSERDEHQPQVHEPVRETPRETPAHVEAPSHVETPAHVEQPRRVEQPTRNEQPSGGLEEEHIARQRAPERSSGGNENFGGNSGQRGGGNGPAGNGGGGRR